MQQFAELPQSAKAELPQRAKAESYNSAKAERYNSAKAERYNSAKAERYNSAKAERYNSAKAERYKPFSLLLYIFSVSFTSTIPNAPWEDTVGPMLCPVHCAPNTVPTYSVNYDL
jgi:hypothetical protein